MGFSLAFAALAALASVAPAVVVQPSAVGPLSPDKHPSTSLHESIRRMKLSLDRELVYLAHMEHLSKHTDTNGMVARQQQPSAAVIHGFTTVRNDGTGIFRPILPGTDVPPARFVAGEPVESPAEETEEPDTTFPPAVTAIETPIVTPDVEPMPTAAMSTMMPITPSDEPVDPAMPVGTSPPRDVTFLPAPSAAPDAPVEPSDAPTPPAPVAPSLPIDDAVPVDVVPTEGAVAIGDASTTEDPASIAPGAAGEVPAGPTDEEEEISPTPEDDAVCFPAHATVQLQDGSVKSMGDVQIGDRVMVGPNTFSDVFMFTHKLSNVRHRFVRLDLSSGHHLALTHGHYLYVNGRLSAASTVSSGDTLMLADSSLARVTRVSSIDATGLFNPQTVHGDIVVNGVLASTYTTAVQPKLAHALLAPLRAAYSRLGLCMTAFEAGADSLARYIPSGSIIN